MDTSVKYTVEEIREKITTNRAWVEHAIVRLFEEQTPQEQDTETTVYNNHRGFSALDADLLSSFAKQILRKQEYAQRGGRKFVWGNNLSDKQIPYAFKKLAKYAGQLYRLSYGENPPKEKKRKEPEPTAEPANKWEYHRVDKIGIAYDKDGHPSFAHQPDDPDYKFVAFEIGR